MKGEPFRAWQPLTFGGIARYAHDWVGRLFFTGILISIIATAAVILTARRTWIPVIDTAVTQLPQLPPGPEIRAGRFTAPQALRLAENTFLSIRLDPSGDSFPPSTADVEVTLNPSQLRVRTLFGAALANYQPQWTLGLNRTEMEPWWGAWRITAYGYLAAGTIAFLFVSWISLAIPYAIVVRLLALMMKRRVSLWGSWKLSIAALMPGALLFSFGIFLYGWSQIRMIELIGIWVTHFVVGWIFLIGALFYLPRIDASNPFGKSPKWEEAEEPIIKNPFRRPENK